MSHNPFVSGSAFVRQQLGVLKSDTAVFRPFELAETFHAARIIAEDTEIPYEIRVLVPVGVCLDLAPNHLAPSIMRLRSICGIRAVDARAHRLAWEFVPPAQRFEIVARAVGMVLAWRGAARR